MKHPMFCLLSNQDTWNPQECVKTDSLQKAMQRKMTIEQCAQCKEKKHVQDISSDERDGHMGHVPGITAQQMDEKGNITEVTDKYRLELLGKGLHESHV